MEQKLAKARENRGHNPQLHITTRFTLTQKPVASLTPLIEAFSKPGDLVLDPFAGSGTTGVAARSCRRRFLLIEKDPTYHKAACARLR